MMSRQTLADQAGGEQRAPHLCSDLAPLPILPKVSWHSNLKSDKMGEDSAAGEVRRPEHQGVTVSCSHIDPMFEKWREVLVWAPASVVQLL